MHKSGLFREFLLFFSCNCSLWYEIIRRKSWKRAWSPKKNSNRRASCTEKCTSGSFSSPFPWNATIIALCDSYWPQNHCFSIENSVSTWNFLWDYSRREANKNFGFSLKSQAFLGISSCIIKAQASIHAKLSSFGSWFFSEPLPVFDSSIFNWKKSLYLSMFFGDSLKRDPKDKKILTPKLFCPKKFLQLS